MTSGRPLALVVPTHAIHAAARTTIAAAHVSVPAGATPIPESAQATARCADLALLAVTATREPVADLQLLDGVQMARVQVASGVTTLTRRVAAGPTVVIHEVARPARVAIPATRATCGAGW